MNKNVILAILFSLASALALSLSAAIVKFVSKTLPLDLIIFIRFLIGFFYVVFFLLYHYYIKDNPISISLTSWTLHLLRAFSGLLAMYLLYYSLRFIPLVDGVLLQTTYPLFIPIIMALIFGIHTHLKIWIFLSIGFIGVVFVLHPTSNILSFKAIPALGAGFASAVSLIATRKLSIENNTFCVLFYYFLISTITSGFLSILNWHVLTWHELCLLLVAGILGAMFQEFLIRALAYASSRTVSSLMYFNIIFSALLGWIIWKEIPDLFVWTGVVLICLGSISVILLFRHEEGQVGSYTDDERY